VTGPCAVFFGGATARAVIVVRRGRQAASSRMDNPELRISPMLYH